jgi:predicted alpha/beta hydrolase family esterase
MMSRILRVLSLLVVVAAVVIAWSLVQIGAPVWLAVIVALLLPLAVHGVPLAIEFVIGALIDRRPVARLSPVAFVRTWWGETWRSFIAFSVDQPWRANFDAPALVQDPQRPAVLLVHGYMCNRGVWRPWIVGNKLPRHWNVATLDLEPVFGPVEGYAAVIDKAVGELRAATGAAQVTLVCHSMGGLAARAYLREYGTDAVARAITIDTPHHGTLFARFGHGANTRQMRNACDYLRKLAEQDETVDFICFASQHDNLIVPRASQSLECAETIWFEGVGHLAMTANDDVLARLIEVVERPLPDRPRTALRSEFPASSSPLRSGRPTLSSSPLP